MSGQETVISSFKDAKKVHLGLFFAEDKKVNYNCLVIAYLKGNLATVECWPTDDIRTGIYTETMMSTDMKFPFTCIAKIIENEAALDEAKAEDALVEGFFIFKKEVSNEDIL